MTDTCGTLSDDDTRYTVAMTGAVYYAKLGDYTHALSQTMDAWSAAVRLHDVDRATVVKVLMDECFARLGAANPSSVARRPQLPHK